MTVNIPTGLRHVLDVYRHVRQFHRSRIKAIKEVAAINRINPQTVLSSCTRSLGIGTADFELFLKEEMSGELCTRLVRRYPSHRAEIEDFFRIFDSNNKSHTDVGPGNVMRVLFPKEQQDLLRILLLRGIKEQIVIWLKRHDIPDDVRIEMERIREQLNGK